MATPLALPEDARLTRTARHGNGRRNLSAASDRDGLFFGRREGTSMNFVNAQRVLSALGGGALVAYGLRRRDMLGSLTAAAGGLLIYRAVAGRFPALGALLPGTRSDGRERQGRVNPDEALEVERSVTVLATPEELYSLWRDFSRLPGIMDYLERVTILSERRSHWVAKAPAGTSVEWDAEITEDRRGEIIAWESVPPAQIPNRGRVRFVPASGDRGTEVHVYLQYEPPVGKLGNAAARLFGRSPDQEVRNALTRVKQLVEVGEIPTVEGQPSGRR